jgi:hypothetical protein
LQDEIAASVAKILQARGSPGLAARFMTKDADAWLGRKQECIALLAELITKPSFITMPYLRRAPRVGQRARRPAFQALLADPQNSAPLWENDAMGAGEGIIRRDRLYA